MAKSPSTKSDWTPGDPLGDRDEAIMAAHFERLEAAADAECPRCHGSGEIGWNDSPINDPQCAQEATCNVCHGEGVV